MTNSILIVPIIIPLIGALIVWLLPEAMRRIREIFVFSLALINLAAIAVLFNKEIVYQHAWLGNGFEFSLRLYPFSYYILAASGIFSFLIALYSLEFLRKKDFSKKFYTYFFITLGFTNGAVLSDNLLLMLFFGEGLLLTLFGMIIIGGKDASKAAIKALVIMGVSDLIMMMGVIISIASAGTASMSAMSLPLDNMTSIGYLCLMIGALSKAGAVPFHTWIPDAALSAPLPFMAFLPASLEKLLGIYFLARISLDLFQLTSTSWLSILLMIIGAGTLLLAVMMALIQKNYKRLLAYHAVSQVGYMILGIGTMMPAGILAGLFHMVNHCIYKCCLFMTGGAVERQAGTCELEKLGGIGVKMPVTFVCFIVAAFSISGMPPFNGFFSKELLYDAALQRGIVFYIIAIAGSFFTATSFLKLGHSVFLGRLNYENRDVHDAPVFMLVPMVVLSSACIIFGLWNTLPINIIQNILGYSGGEYHFAGWPENNKLVMGTMIVLGIALLHHLIAVKMNGAPSEASSHIHNAPVLSWFYDKAEKRFFDPYEIGLNIMGKASGAMFWVDRKMDLLYESVNRRAVWALGRKISAMHTGNYALYLAWTLLGVLGVVICLICLY